MLISSALAATLTVPGDYPTIQDAVDAGADGDVVEMTGSLVSIQRDAYHERSPLKAS